ncbi:MAG: hypothetical protein KDA94_13810 [Acidimicrobiales bacterium]|nr:hypothetical protein [Acidimicrobiales bacterium]
MERDPLTGRRNRRVLAWAALSTVALLVAAEVGVRALGDLPVDRTWPDAESQFKAEHALGVAARGEREPVVFAGSSVSDAAFDPAVVQEAAGTDEPMFNYALEGSLSDSTARFLRAAVLDQVDPDVVVLGVFPGDIGASPTHAAALGDELSRSRGYRLASGHPTMADRIDDAASRRSALVAHRAILRDPVVLARWLRSPSTPPFLDPETGALLRHRDVVYEPPAPDPDPDPDAASSGDETVPIGPQVQAIEDLAADLAEQGKRLVIVELPVLVSGWDDRAALDETHRAMVRVEQAGCSERLDLRSELQDESYWSDPSHVNGSGTAAISDQVGTWLAAHPDAPTGC